MLSLIWYGLRPFLILNVQNACGVGGVKVNKVRSHSQLQNSKIVKKLFNRMNMSVCVYCIAFIWVI